MLKVCGPGGPYLPVKECAAIFSSRRTVEVDVIKSEPSQWRRLWEDGVDVFYGGADYMLEDFDRENPGVIDLQRKVEVCCRRIGIIVRGGNPLAISSLEDLGGKGAKLLDVRLENMGRFQERGFAGERGIFRSVLTGQDGRDAWVTAPELDAWITYRTWHVSLEDGSEFVPISGDEALRWAPAAITNNTRQRELAEEFVGFISGDEAHAIFSRYGWD